ncbi:hypothetical protein GCM10010219_38010 [Streptomyces netropsis]|nr:hypothetical protein GCM10010219_38010 [Streptomyces netropsis]
MAAMSTTDDAHFTVEAPLTTLPTALADAARQDGVCARRLLETVEGPRSSLEQRLIAATLLGVVGDPRTPPVPAVLTVRGGRTTIGLAEERVAAVARAWAHVGVEEPWIAKEAPEHPVTLGDFAIGAYPVTNHQYLCFLLDRGYPRRPATWQLGAYPWQSGNHPVCGVTPEDAQAYLSWLGEISGRAFRLPTEAEWEYAAKGPQGWEYPWGEEFRAELANTRESGPHTTTPVGVYPRGRSPFGVWDMAGNVEELTSDDYAPYPGGVVVDDHLSRTLGRYRVTRGGSFARFGDLARTRRRHGAFPSPLYPIGFRVALTTTDDRKGPSDAQ